MRRVENKVLTCFWWHAQNGDVHMSFTPHQHLGSTTSLLVSSGCAPNREESMTLHLPATCLVTLAFVADQFLATTAFIGIPLGANKRHHNRRIRARLSSPTQQSSTTSDSRRSPTGHRVPPPPERRSRADTSRAEMSSSPIADLALQNLNAAEAGRPAARRAGSAKENARSKGLTATPRNDMSGRREGAAGRADVHPAVARQLASGNVIGAISLLVSAADDIEAGIRPNLNASSETTATAAVDAVDGVNCGTPSDVLASLRKGFVAVLQSCAKRGLWREANRVVTRHMPAAGVEASTADWLLAIDACAGPEGSEQAVFYLHDMRMRGFEITRDVYGAAVRACSLSGGTARTLFLLKDASKRGVPLPPAAVEGVMRAAGWQQALTIYEAFVELAAGQAQTRSASEGGSPSGVGGSLGDAGGDDLPGRPRGQARQLHLLSEVAPGWKGVCQAALEACAKGGKWETALEILNVLRAGGGGAELSMEAYDKAIEVCGDAKAWDMVLLLVAEMRSDGVPTSPSAFETALKGCAATGSWSWARSLMSSVSADAASGVRLTVSHYLEALRSCAAVVDKPGGAQARSAANAALELLQDIREARWLGGRQGEDAYLWAMKACISAQDAWSALALLDSAQDDRVRRTMALRTAAMQACSGAGEWRAALSILDDVHLEGLRPSGAAYVAAMAACARGGVVDLALELLDKVLVEHPGDKRTITSGYHGAIAACAECGHWEGATSLLQRMRRDSLAVVTSKEYNAAILACCRAQQSVAALTLLGDMSTEEGAVALDKDNRSSAGGSSRLRPDETSYICVMRSFGKERRWRTVLDLLGSMKEEAGLTPSVSTYNVVVEALAKAGEWQRALGMLSEMKREGVRPTEFTYNRCMTACEKSGRWEQTLSLMKDMKGQEDLVPDSYMCSTAMMACSKAGRLDDVLGILQELREMPGGNGPNLVNYNIVIGSCARARNWTRMLEEMEKMRWEEFKPEESTFSVPLDVCARSGDLSMALTLLARMRECKVKPGVVTFGSAVAAACRAGDAASAAELLDEMAGAGHPPNEVTYGIAALACRDSGNADAAVDLLRRRERQGLSPDPLTLSFAVQACSKAGDLERGMDLITGMKSAGFVPDGLFYTGVIAGIGASFSPTHVRSRPVCGHE